MDKAIYIPYDIGLRVQQGLFGSILFKDSSDESHQLYAKLINEHMSTRHYDNKSGLIVLTRLNVQKGGMPKAMQMWSLYDSTVRFSCKTYEISSTWDDLCDEVSKTVAELKDNDKFGLYCGFDYVKRNWNNKTD